MNPSALSRVVVWQQCLVASSTQPGTNAMRSLTLTCVALLISSCAYAQTTTTPQGNPSGGNVPTNQDQSATQQKTGAQIANEIRSNLESAGFKNIKLMPSSFIVRAEDKNGNPVMMVLNPDSITSVTEINSSSGTTVGQSQTPETDSSDSHSTAGTQTK
jgi:hypothetical protein